MATVGRLFQPPKGHFFLFGPRGTGKSTWIEQTWPEALRIDLLAPDTLRVFLARPERLRERIAANPGREVVVIDEVQRAPALLDVVHEQIEARKRGPQRAGRLLDIEVKNGRRVQPADLRGLRAFGADYPTARLGLVYRGSERLVIEGVPCIPAAELLPAVRPGQPLPL